MKLIVDTNILFSFFNERSKARELSLLPDLELHSPAFSIDELVEHKSEIITRFSLSDAQFLLIERLLKVVVKFINEEEYSKFLSEARKVSPDPNDSDFFHSLYLFPGFKVMISSSKLNSSDLSSYR